MLSYILYLGVKRTMQKKKNHFKDHRKFSFFSNRKSVRLGMRSWSENELEKRQGKNLRCKQLFVWWFLLVSGFSGQLTIWWHQSPEVTFHFLSNARKIRLWGLKPLASNFLNSTPCLPQKVMERWRNWGVISALARPQSFPPLSVLAIQASENWWIYHWRMF